MKAKLALVCLFSFMAAVFAQKSADQMQEYFEMCDASAALAVDDQHFIMANDEDNILRVYRFGEKKPVSTKNMSSFFRIQYDDKSPEADIEGAARLGDYYFFMTSHGRDKNGRLRQNRCQFFAVQVNPQTMEITPVGASFQKLMDHLVAVKELQKVSLLDHYQPNNKKDESLAPKERGVNLEGLAVSPDGQKLLIGFRNPVPKGKAIVIELLNPVDVILHGKAPEFGQTWFLDLLGRGVRSLEYSPSLRQYLIVGGAIDEESQSKLYLWDGASAASPRELTQVEWRQYENFNPEVIILDEAQSQLRLFSDDGTRTLKDSSGNSCDCKDLGDADRKKFRAITIDYSALK